MLHSIEIPPLWKIFLTLFLLLICRIVVKFFIILYFKLRRFQNVPGSLCIYRPIVGILPDIVQDFEKYYDSAYATKELIKANPETRLIVFTVGAGVATILTDIDLIKDFLNRQSKIASKDSRIINPDPNIGTGLLLAEGEKWKTQRKLISQVFHFEYMNQCLPTINRTLKEWIDSNCFSDPSIVNISIQSKTFTSTVIWRIFFGEESFASEKEEAKRLIALSLKNANDAIGIILNPLMALFGPKFFRLGLRASDRQYFREKAELQKFFKSKLEKLKSNVLEEKQNGIKPERPRNLIELLLDESMKAEATDKMPDKDILEQISTFFIAGTDTTAQVIIMAHYILGNNDEIQNKLREDVKKVVSEDEEIKYEHLAKMEYMTAFLKEILRCHGPATGLFPRMITEDTMIGDVKFLKGSSINVSMLATAYNSKYFDEPGVFRPERWLEKDEKGVRDQLAFLPFSAGSRRCIGEQLVYIEAKTIIAELLRRFKIKIQEPYKLRMWQGLVYEAKNPLSVIYTKL